MAANDGRAVAGLGRSQPRGTPTTFAEEVHAIADTPHQRRQMSVPLLSAARQDSFLRTDGTYLQPPRMPTMASRSACVTQRRYLALTAVWKATYLHRKALFGGS